MGKRFNYFEDDELIISGKAPKSRGRNLIAFFKYVFVVAFVTISRFLKEMATPRGRAGARRRLESLRSRVPVSGGVRILIVFLLVIALVVSSFLINIRIEDKREKRFNDAAYNVCSEYNKAYGIANYKSLFNEYGIKGYMMTGLCYARELDFDNDSISELLVIYNDNDVYYAEVWGFHSKEFKKLYGRKLTYSDNFNDDIWLALYIDGRKTYIAEHDIEDISRVKILRLSGDKFVERRDASYDAVTQGYSIRGTDKTESFEQIKLSVLKEYNASLITESVYSTVDGFADYGKRSEEVSVSTAPKGMKGAYWGIIERYVENYGNPHVLSDSGCAYIDGLAGVELVDFDGDDTKELVLIYRKSLLTRGEDNRGNMITYQEPEYFCEIYAYKNKMATMVYQSQGLSDMLNSPSTKYLITRKAEKGAVLCVNRFSVEDYGRTIRASSRQMKLEEGVFNTTQKASYVTRYGYTSYYIDDREVYKSRFEQNGGFDVPFFDGGDTLPDGDEWSVLYVQAPGGERKRLEEQVDKTIETIKEINPEYIK